MSKAKLESAMIGTALILLTSACGDAPTRQARATASSTLPYTKDEDAVATRPTSGNDTANSDSNNSGSGSGNNSQGGSNSSSGDDEGSTTPSKDPVVVTPTKPSIPSTTPTVPETTKPVQEPVVDSLCYKADAFICEIEKVIVEETNKHRTTALIHNKESSWVSRQWSDAQAASGQISHDGFPAARKAALTAEFPTAKWSFYAENVAMNQSSGSDATKIGKAFVEMWWNSAGHKANMLGNYKSIGVGVSKKGNSYYATQIFY